MWRAAYVVSYRKTCWIYRVESVSLLSKFNKAKYWLVHPRNFVGSKSQLHKKCSVPWVPDALKQQWKLILNVIQVKQLLKAENSMNSGATYFE